MDDGTSQGKDRVQEVTASLAFMEAEKLSSTPDGEVAAGTLKPSQLMNPTRSLVPSYHSTAEGSDSKIPIIFQNVGNAPILAKNKFAVGGDKLFADIILSLRKMLKIEQSVPLFVYVNSAFVPSPSQSVADLFQCFGRANQLVLNYSIQEAWG